MNLDAECKAARERLHRSIGQKCRHALQAIKARAECDQQWAKTAGRTIRFRRPTRYQPLAEIIIGNAPQTTPFVGITGTMQDQTQHMWARLSRNFSPSRGGVSG